MAVPPYCSASARPRSTVRLAMVTCFGFWAQKWAAHSSIISPAPMNRMRCSAIDSKMRSARCTPAAAIDTILAPMAVVLRTSLATEKERWNSLCSCVPSVPFSSAARTASFIWPRICGSPMTIESRPLATRKAWRMASGWLWV
jgi:hypothetical protein